MNTGEWTLADSGLSQEEKEQLVKVWRENQNETDIILTQLEQAYILNNIPIEEDK